MKPAYFVRFEPGKTNLENVSLDPRLEPGNLVVFSRRFSGLNLGKKSRLTEPGKNVRFDPNLDLNLTFFQA